MSNRYLGMHTWLLIRHCIVCNNNRKSFGKMGCVFSWLKWLTMWSLEWSHHPVTISIYFFSMYFSLLLHPLIIFY